MLSVQMKVLSQIEYGSSKKSYMMSVLTVFQTLSSL